ncbi:CBS domain-containing protein [Aestuariispira insulae]|uniref:CBS domain protein n=1 Tax=Aestuariispira insulae TaxID=1461337 RepID=A0A3D9HP40_9PROT|nr:CBS domain-containing protein [Aestuariispira insulae]RED51264.1 CBS domain protein [Aestuariispira insulae]
MRVASLLTTKGSDIISLRDDATINDAVKLLCERKIGATIVLGPEGKLAGILSERDIIRGMGVSGGAGIGDKPVSSLMTTSVECCHPDDTVDSIMQRMTMGRFRHMPVMEEGKLVGVISIGDVVKNRISDLELEANAMRDYIAGA